MLKINLKAKNLELIFLINSLLYGLVYFYPLNNFGEPTIPIFLKLIFDLLLLQFYFASGFKKFIDIERALFLNFLIICLIIGLVHIPQIGIIEFIHFTVRNVFFYSLVFFVNFYNPTICTKFSKFHLRVFEFVLYAGLILFSLRILKINNPFAFGAWFWEGNRLISTWLNPNSLGFYLLYYLIFNFYNANKINLKFVLTALSIFLTGSLTAIIGVIYFLFIVIAENFYKRFDAKYFIFFLLTIPFLVYGSFAFGVFEYIFFKIDVLFINETGVHTSVSTRVENITNLLNYLNWSNLPSILFGDFNTHTFVRLDSQYLNIFYNYGLFALLSYFIFMYVILRNLSVHNNVYSKTMFVFCIWMFLIAFNLTAYLFRSNVSVFFYIMLGLTIYFNKQVSNEAMD